MRYIMNIDSIRQDKCDECGQEKKGVRFRLGGSDVFLCWEHFRLTTAALRETRPAVVRETTIIEHHRTCCCPQSYCCSCHCTRTHWRSHTYGESRGRTMGISEGHTIGISERRTEGRG